MLPEHQQANRNTLLRAFGYVSRVALALLCTYALARFTFDCLDINAHGGVIFAMAAAVCTVFGVMLYTKRLIIGGAVVLTSSVMLLIGLFGNIFEVLWLVGAYLYNSWCARLSALRHTAFRGDSIDITDKLEKMDLDESRLMLLTVFLVILVLGAISALSTVRRARVVLYLGVGTALAAVALSFDLYKDKVWLFLMIAVLCGVAALGVYDSVYCSRRHIRAQLGMPRKSPAFGRELDHILRVNSSLGGYVGICATVIALALMAVPMQISKPMEDIAPVSNTAAKVENFISAVLRTSGGGAAGVVFGEDAATQARGATAQRRVFTGKRIFDVQSDVKVPIYLRSWVGTDYVGDCWYTVSQERIDEYRKRFGGGFSHEYLSAELLRAIDPALVKSPSDVGECVYHHELGYVSTYVHIDKKAPTESLVYLPSYTDQRTRLLPYASNSSASTRGYSNYYDGIFTSADYVLVDDYTVLTHLQTQPNTDSILGISALVTEYARQYELLREMRAIIASGGDEDDVRGYFDGAADAEFTEERSVSADYTFPSGEDALAYRYAYTMSAAERREIDALMDNLPLYYEFVYDSYLTGCENFSLFEMLVGEICGATGTELRKKAQSYTGRHEITEAIIDYLSENMTYTIDPIAPDSDRTYKNAADSFLFDTKEGYCVQYASAAVMLLRAAGIPARYAEGYVAHGFSASPDGDIAKYEVTVRDSNAHAWVEVYYDYYGWITYEATSSHVVGDSYGDIDVGANATPDTEPTDTTDTEPLDTEPTNVTTSDTSPTRPVTTDGNSGQTGTSEKRDVRVGVIITVLVIALAAAGVVFIVYRGRMLEGKRLEIVEIARRGLVSERDRRVTAEYIGDEIMKLLSLLRLVPESGERASAFAKRVDNTLGELDGKAFSVIMPIIQKAEFSGEVSSDELASVACYYKALYRVAQERVNPFMRAYIRYGAVFRK